MTPDEHDFEKRLDQLCGYSSVSNGKIAELLENMASTYRLLEADEEAA